jgi:hypothetical protein
MQGRSRSELRKRKRGADNWPDAGHGIDLLVQSLTQGLRLPGWHDWTLNEARRSFWHSDKTVRPDVQALRQLTRDVRWCHRGSRAQRWREMTGHWIASSRLWPDASGHDFSAMEPIWCWLESEWLWVTQSQFISRSASGHMLTKALTVFNRCDRATQF